MDPNQFSQPVHQDPSLSICYLQVGEETTGFLASHVLREARQNGFASLHLVAGVRLAHSDASINPSSMITAP